MARYHLVVAVGSGVNNHILTAQGSPHLTPLRSPSDSQLPSRIWPDSAGKSD